MSAAAGDPKRRTVFAGRLISVEVVEGRYREIVHHPGACAAVALHGNDVLLVRQLRDAVGERLLEVPAGVRDVEGEEPADCAAREVAEETGYRVTHIEPLGRVFTSPGFTDEAIELFLARVEPDGQGEDEIEVVRMPLEEAARAVHDGRIRDAKSAVAILLAAGRVRGLHRGRRRLG
ncbi:MAG: NUDIX hydrolase [Actinomycetota bacterium]